MSKGRITIWDSDFIPFYCCHVKKDDPEKSFEDVQNCCIDLINNVNRSLDANNMIMCFTKGKCFRYDVYPEYKSNRKYGDPPKWLFETKDWLINKFNGQYLTYYESDDLVLIYKNKLEELGYECIIVSPDKDILYLEGLHYNPKKNELVITNKEDASKFFWTSMITGDTTDGLCGIKGIGKVGAEKLLVEIDVFETYRNIVFNKYCEIYGEELGIEMFYKMYKCLKIVGKDDTLDLPPLLALNKEVSEEKRLFE